MMIFQFIAAKRAEHSIQVMCRVLGVSRSGFHAWERREPSRRAGRVHAELRLEHGSRVGGKRVERPMRRAGLAGQIKRRRGKTTIRVQGVPDLVCRDFAATGPDRLWSADISYIRR